MQEGMIKSAIKYCIENFNSDIASDRITEYIKDCLEQKEKEFELIKSINQLKEIDSDISFNLK